MYTSLHALLLCTSTTACTIVIYVLKTMKVRKYMDVNIIFTMTLNFREIMCPYLAYCHAKLHCNGTLQLRKFVILVHVDNDI